MLYLIFLLKSSNFSLTRRKYFLRNASPRLFSRSLNLNAVTGGVLKERCSEKLVKVTEKNCDDVVFSLNIGLHKSLNTIPDAFLSILHFLFSAAFL